MLDILKRALGRGSESTDDSTTTDEPLIVEFRLAYRPHVDANGWETVDSWPTWEMDRDEDLPLTRAEFRAQLGPEASLGHYKLFPVDEDSRLRPAEWGLTHGTEAEARREKRRREQRESESGSADEDDSSIPPEMWASIQETWEETDDIFGLEERGR